ncbi:MAG: TIGR02117 family protein [Nitratireductor sp.]
MRTFLQCIGVIAITVILYLGAAFVGALIPAQPIPAAVAGQSQAGEDGASRRIYLLTTLLHADIAIPVNDALRSRFDFLGDAGVPIDHPGLKYLIFGWGSREFYTRTARLSDIRPATAFRAITGDASVMHVYAAGDVSGLESAFGIDLPPGGPERLLAFIETGFARDAGRPVPIDGVSYGMADAFFAGVGHFDIMRPCNIWVGEALREAGLATGVWTPITGALKLGLQLHASRALENGS